MTAAHVLVLYASTHGHTGKIADRIATVMRGEGLEVRDRQLGAATEHLDLAAFDGVVVGASVHMGHHQHELVDWIAEHRESLGARPSAFFSVSLTAADDTDEARATTSALIADVADSTGWVPALTESFAGALQFREYGLPTRVIMRLMARRIEHQTGTAIDVHEDTDYTDWAAVDRFALGFAATVSLQRRGLEEATS
ncbi:MAG: protoporphyrinogen oxidase [Conexibacter sp.]|nr:protoporphyrinogen oxidase [Conexibacter sp.]